MGVGTYLFVGHDVVVALFQSLFASVVGSALACSQLDAHTEIYQ
jgi:hypothetical protein